jgi:hypothetical protein
MTPEDHYITLVEIFTENPNVTLPIKRGIGSGLRIHNKIFAIFTRDRLIVKLGRKRVNELTDLGQGEPMTLNNRVAKDWLMISPGYEEQWMSLAQEALNVVNPKP